MADASLEQQMAQACIDMLPAFVPKQNASVKVSEQEQFYLLVTSLLAVVIYRKRIRPLSSGANMRVVPLLPVVCQEKGCSSIHRQVITRRKST